MLNEEPLDHDLDQFDLRHSSDEDSKYRYRNSLVDDRRASVTRTSVDVNDVFQQDIPLATETEKTTLTKV